MSTTEWPELVGMIQVVRDGSVVTMDFRTDRVRIFVDDKQKIVQVPCIG